MKSTLRKYDAPIHHIVKFDGLPAIAIIIIAKHPSTSAYFQHSESNNCLFLLFII